MKKNSQLHIVLETKLLEFLKEKANSKGVSLAEYCRGKLVQNSQLDKIELMLERVLEKNGNK